MIVSIIFLSCDGNKGTGKEKSLLLGPEVAAVTAVGVGRGAVKFAETF